MQNNAQIWACDLLYKNLVYSASKKYLYCLTIGKSTQFFFHWKLSEQNNFSYQVEWSKHKSDCLSETEIISGPLFILIFLTLYLLWLINTLCYSCLFCPWKSGKLANVLISLNLNFLIYKIISASLLWVKTLSLC